MTTTLDVRGMSCDGCEDIVENALTDVSGVEDATADQTSESATVDGDADPDELVQAVELAGYEAELGNA
jgi:copper chaperone CopZ